MSARAVKDNKKDIIQQKALKAWKSKGKVGTCEIITGLGKTFIGLHALYEMPKDFNTIHLFLAESTDRKKDLAEQIKKYNKIFGRDVMYDYNLQFFCYQSAYRWKGKKFGLVIGDEIHDAMSPSYSKFFINNSYKAVIGLTATVPKNTKYIIDGNIVTKRGLLDKIVPVCFTYTVSDGQLDGTSRKLNVFVINHKLDPYNKTVLAGSKTNRFKQTEVEAYSYWDKQYRKAWFIVDEETKQLKIRISSSKRKKILYELESKIKQVKSLLTRLHKKTIIFGNSIDSLLKVTPNVVSSRNSDTKNKQIRHAFDTNRIRVIGSFKKLKQGANLNGLDNCIIMSYYGTDKDLIQRIGRLRQDGTEGNVFIFVTEETQEVIWFNKMFEGIDNLSLTHCEDVEDCLKQLKDG